MYRLAAAVLCLLTLTSAAAAQGHPQTREGFWISFGLGTGSLGCDCDDDDERITGGAAYLRMGGTLSQRLLLGGEANAWSRDEGNVTVSIGNVTPILIFYPSADGGFFLKGGVGLASAELEIGPFSGEETGVGVTVGLGYDARVSRGFALTPFFDLVISSFEADITNETYSFNRITFGLGFTWP